MQKHKCKLCSKSFCNGRALGGHMKSHLVIDSLSSRHVSTRKRFGADSALAYGLRENPRKSFRVFKPDQDLCTETEPEFVDSVRIQVRTRSKTEVSKKKKKQRTSRLLIDSDESQEEDLAMCLMMLSRDSREAVVEIKPVFEEGEETKPEKIGFTEVRRRCLIDLNLPPPQDSDVVVTVV